MPARSAGFVAAQIQAAVAATAAKVRWPAATARVDLAGSAAAAPVDAASLSSATGTGDMAAVTVGAAVDQAAVTVTEMKEPAAVAGVDPDADTVRLPRFIARGKKPRKRRQAPRLLRSGARVVFVSPWLAVGAGLVIAAALVIASPHMALNTNNFRTMPCDGCKVLNAAPSDPPGRQLTHSPPGQVATQASRRERLLRGMKFSYSVAWQHGDQFAVMITLSSKRQLHHWRVAFTMPGASGLNVDNASFRPNTRGDGGFATPLSGRDAFGGDHGDAVGQDWGQHPTSGNMIVFFVTGTGTFTKLTHTRFDGIHCQFMPLHFPDRSPR